MIVHVETDVVHLATLDACHVQDQSRLWLQQLLVDVCVVHGRLAEVTAPVAAWCSALDAPHAYSHPHWSPLLRPGPLLLSTLMCHHNFGQIQSNLPLDAQELHLHLICEELQTRDDINIASESAVRMLLTVRGSMTPLNVAALNGVELLIRLGTRCMLPCARHSSWRRLSWR